MPPRKSNISQAIATEEGGTPTKEREGGTNIEVPYRSSYSLFPPGFPLESYHNFANPISLSPSVVPMASSPSMLCASLPSSPLAAYGPAIGSYDNPLVVENDEDDKDDDHDPWVVSFAYTKNDFIGQDLSLPRTMVQRLAKGVLPPNTSLHKDAVLALSKGATVFINYLAQAYVPARSLAVSISGVLLHSVE